MPGPAPKHPSQRRRRNTVSTTKTLVAVSGQLDIPELPTREIVDAETGEVEQWHEAATDFWNNLWTSPMASEYDRSDLTGLLILAELMHAFFTCPPNKLVARKELASEIRLQRKEYGLGPMARRTLQWTIENAEEATDKGDRRRSSQVSRSGGADDPRLRVIDVQAEEE